MGQAPRLVGMPTWQLSRAAARAHRVLQEHLTRVGATGYEYRVLASLGDLKQVSQAELGSAAGLDRRDVTHTVRALETKRLVTRQSNPRDARQHLVELTEAGRQRLQQLDVIIGEAQREVFGALNAADRRALLHLLQRVAQSAR